MTISGKGAALVTVLLLGGMGDVVANENAKGAVTLDPISVVAERDGVLQLPEGPSEHQRIMDIDRYVFDIEEPTRMEVRSHLWAATSPNNVVLRGTLYDENDNVVAEGRSMGGRFAFDRTLEPGYYALDVKGQFLSGTQGGSQRYYLTTRMDAI
ncbi:hypothetical protein MKP05_04440 [Halomonas sp. EGI 63088]|uniref:Uncharacterized protein n=1 Tax=Halomonas flagellata TaxID=2920385 RepID=A0ABS9RRD7_9GAMM|nr:hypothetical protein [Halomonas flagellata]MCH4562382.1 hypothetical protein [Halomonas flagellata]